jgi:prepilin-type N-terminal cleavage/methylation domain-containing protein
VNLRLQMKNLQGERQRVVSAGTISLWLVVGWPGRAHKVRSGFHHAFTLVELLLVLALLAVAVAVAAPSLSRFFHGRALDSEGRRMLALTRYAQSRAVSEGVPMVMWFNPEEKTYGVEAEVTYADKNESDKKLVKYVLDTSIEMEMPRASTTTKAPWQLTTEIAGIHPSIRFTPDGFIDEASPEWVWLKVKREDYPDAVWLARSNNRLNYELQDTLPAVDR